MIEIVDVERFPITLAQFMKWCGLAITGGEAKEIIKEGMVKINGERCQIPGKKLEDGDEIIVSTEEGNLIYKVRGN